ACRLLVGPAVQQAEEIFDQYWNSSVVIPINALAKRSGSELKALRRRLSELALAESNRPYLDSVRERLDFAATLSGISVHFTERARVISDPPEKALGKLNTRWLT